MGAYGPRGRGLVIKGMNDWRDGRPQVAMHRYIDGPARRQGV